MSDPAKSSEEIEDVLASIRRLVSDHTAAQARPAVADLAVRPAAEEPSEEIERLVLTPSFRVSEAEQAGAPAAQDEDDDTASGAEADADADATGTETLVAGIISAEDAAEDEAGDGVGADIDADADTGAASRSDWQPTDRMAEFDAVGDAGGQPDEDAHADEAAAPAPATADIADVARREGLESAPEDFESETGDENWPGEGAEAALLTLVARREPAPEPAPPSDASAPDADIAEAQDPGTAGNDSADFDADASEADASEADASEADVDLGAAEPAQASNPDTAPSAGPEADEAAADEPAAVPVFSRRAQAEQDRGAGASQDPSPDAGEDLVGIGSDIENAELGEDPLPFELPNGEDGGILDEETLREIIVDVVREELQGVLGQRITRNVRKMVRREVRLALAAEDLE